MDDRASKIEEAPASPEGQGFVEAQQVTSNYKNKTKPNKDLGRVAAGKKLAE